jgi:hypothetical protein
MNLYKQKLIKHHLTEENASRIAKALKELHFAIAAMDSRQFSTFQWELPGLATMLDDYATIEEVRVLQVDTIKQSRSKNQENKNEKKKDTSIAVET